MMMKMKQIFLFSFLLLMLTGACNGLEMNDVDLQSDEQAAQYVDELMQSFRDGTLLDFKCPDVRWQHIPRLLEYGKATEIISDVRIPSNPISSFMLLECSEGMFALWMVEAARIYTLNPLESVLDRWPSQNPFVQSFDEDGTIVWFVNNPTVQQEVLDAYVSWWKTSEGKKSAADKDPLEKTIYMWH